MTDVEAKGYGVISDDTFVQARKRIGIHQRLPNPPHNYEVTWDGSRQFAFGYGDDNPLFCDPDYAAETRWGNLIAPPTFLYTVGENVTPRPSPEIKEIMRGDPFAGLGSYQARMDFEWCRPDWRRDRSGSRGRSGRRSRFACRARRRGPSAS